MVQLLIDNEPDLNARDEDGFHATPLQAQATPFGERSRLEC